MAGVWDKKTKNKLDLKMSEHGVLKFCSAQHFLTAAVSTTKIPNWDSVSFPSLNPRHQKARYILPIAGD